MVGIARELNSMLFATAVALLLFSEQGLCQQQSQYRGGMGSHSHMKNSYHGGHSHHRPKLPTEDIPQAQQVKPQKMTKDRDLIRDKEHIKEELAEFLKDKDVSQMSNHELEFHYFKMHDTDGNNKLDGLELLAALLHVHEDDDEEEEVDEEAKISEFRASPDDPPEVKEEKKRKSGEYYRLKSEKRRKAIEAFRFYTKMIDEVLEEDDYNRDGYLNYVEFAASRRRDEEIEKKNTDYSWF